MSDDSGEFNISGFSDDKTIFHAELSVMLSGIRDELDDHRHAINENTNEVESNFEFLAELARKVDLLCERLDTISMQISSQEKVPSAFRVESLTPKEKQVFLSLYAFTEEDPEVTYHQLAARLGMSDDLIAGYVTSLIEKGVLIRKRYVNRVVRLSLDPHFRREQAKLNIVRLDLPLTAWM